MAKGKFKRNTFSLGIGVLLFILFLSGLALFYPDSSESCYPQAPIDTATACTAAGGTWTGSYCDLSTKCNQLRSEYQRNVALIALGVGLIFLAFGLLSKKAVSEFVANGFVLSSLIIIIYGVGQYWSNLNEAFRFGLIALAVLLLIFIASSKKTRKFFYK